MSPFNIKTFCDSAVLWKFLDLLALPCLKAFLAVRPVSPMDCPWLYLAHYWWPQSSPLTNYTLRGLIHPSLETWQSWEKRFAIKFFTWVAQVLPKPKLFLMCRMVHAGKDALCQVSLTPVSLPNTPSWLVIASKSFTCIFAAISFHAVSTMAGAWSKFYPD